MHFISVNTSKEVNKLSVINKSSLNIYCYEKSCSTHNRQVVEGLWGTVSATLKNALATTRSKISSTNGGI